MTSQRKRVSHHSAPAEETPDAHNLSSIKRPEDPTSRTSSRSRSVEVRLVKLRSESTSYRSESTEETGETGQDDWEESDNEEDEDIEEVKDDVADDDPEYDPEQQEKDN